jgi:hypothetical protein
MIEELSGRKKVEAALRGILTDEPDGLFTLDELESRLASAGALRLGAEDVRKALWDLYSKGVAQPVLDEHQEQRWKLAERQSSKLVGWQPMWKTPE